MHSESSSLAIGALFAAAFVVALGSLAVAAPALPVSVDTAKRRAAGTLGSRGDFEPIGCRVYHAFGMAAAVCSARDSAGTQAECTTRDRDLIAAAGSRVAGRSLTFTWDGAGRCTSIVVAGATQS